MRRLRDGKRTPPRRPEARTRLRADRRARPLRRRRARAAGTRERRRARRGVRELSGGTRAAARVHRRDGAGRGARRGTQGGAGAAGARVGDVGEGPERFEWQPVSGAVRYHVALMEVDRRELWAIDTSDTSVTLPAAVRRQIVPSKTLLWQVKAVGAADAPIAESGVE